MSPPSTANRHGRDRTSPALTDVDLRRRSPETVLRDHLRLREAGALEDDLRRNVAPDIVVLTRSGVWRGHDDVRSQAAALARYSTHETFDYDSIVVEGLLAYVEWSAEGPDGTQIHDGADSYVIAHGLIVAQTIHYTVRDRAGSVVKATAAGGRTLTRDLGPSRTHL